MYRLYENHEKTNVVVQEEEDIPDEGLIAIPNPKNGIDCLVSGALGWARYWAEEVPGVCEVGENDECDGCSKNGCCPYDREVA